jgi:hypothetical protein
MGAPQTFETVSPGHGSAARAKVCMPATRPIGELIRVENVLQGGADYRWG